jgi:hypothetical protein
MSNTFQCGDNAALVTYLYDECEPDDRAAITAHIGVCAVCAAEIAALGSARLQLSSWTAPETDLGFVVVGTEASGRRLKGGWKSPSPARAQSRAVRPGPWFRQPLPAWAHVAAACLIFGAGLSLGVLRGTMLDRTAPAQIAAVASSARTATVTAGDLSALEQRLRAEMAGLRVVSAGKAATVPTSGNSAEIMTQVRALIEESEQRQQRELALRTAQVVRDFDSQRRVDLAQIQRNFGQIEGLTGAEVREQRQMLNYLMRVSEQR